MSGPIEAAVNRVSEKKNSDPEALTDKDKKRKDTVFISDTKVFEDEEFATFYQPREDYEGRHRFVPDLKWSQEEERLLVRKIDWKIMLFTCIMFFALQIDRGNIHQALADNFLSDLKLNTNDFNYGQTIFLVSFLSAEVPSQMISKRLGPDNWIPIQMMTWSIVATSQAWINGRATFYVTRALLGLLEGGFIPDVVLYLTYFYKNNELPIRLSWFWTSLTVTNIISAFLAFGLLRMRGINGWAGWQWLFALEGIVTLCIGIFSFFYLPPSPTQTASSFRGKNGWFNEREEQIMVTRILKDDPSKGDMHNRQAITPRKMWLTLKDFDLYPIYFVGLSHLVPNASPSQYLTLTIRAMKFDTYTTTLLTVPASIASIFSLLLITKFSEWRNDKTLVNIINQVYNVIFLTILIFLPNNANVWVRYAVVLLVIAHPNCHAVVVAWTSRNAGSVRTRTIASALYNMAVQIGGIAGSNIYREDDKPFYHRGNRILVGVAAFNLFSYLLIRVYYKKRNAWKKAKWDAMTATEQVNYLKTTEHKGNKRLDFRFAY
ncbi:hypothetical protein HK097_005493 [Rhizophlyctis rosea]|uniref:Major facilitator superfamily (MFS) profile domain-containing protein n=1 Tax=Rhizophlyctis rosea TaxID=64517 RepID=A0AAD5SD96_9FUNG|nr:hypothetical protein HK097_005493 [Rhizophlyctis rosea]